MRANTITLGESAERSKTGRGISARQQSFAPDQPAIMDDSVSDPAELAGCGVTVKPETVFGRHLKGFASSESENKGVEDADRGGRVFLAADPRPQQNASS